MKFEFTAGPTVADGSYVPFQYLLFLISAIGQLLHSGDSSNVPARGRAVRRAAENQTLNQQEFNKAFVLLQYIGYLRRNPNDPQDTDYTGYDFWLSKLIQFDGNF